MVNKIKFYHLTTVIGILLFGLILSLNLKNNKLLEKKIDRKIKIKDTFKHFNEHDTTIIIRYNGKKVYYNYYFNKKFKKKI